MLIHLKKGSQNAFTLIELVIVIALIGILAVAAIPRMMSSYEGAHESSVTATGSALASAVILVRSQWISKGAKGEVDALVGYGKDDVSTSAYGWPSDGQNQGAAKHNTNIANEPDRCIRIWRSLLVDNAPTVSMDGTGDDADYVADAPGGAICRFSYLRNESNSRIEYNLDSGSVVTVL